MAGLAWWSYAQAKRQVKEIKIDYIEPVPEEKVVQVPIKQKEKMSSHSIVSNALTSEQIRTWLEKQTWKGKTGSPLAERAEQISESKYASTILAICFIEQNHCVSAPGNNYWGLGPGIRYDSLEDGIKAIDTFLAKAERKGKTTVESFRGWYCQSACTNWESTVIRTKEKLEQL